MANAETIGLPRPDVLAAALLLAAGLLCLPLSVAAQQQGGVVLKHDTPSCEKGDANPGNQLANGCPTAPSTALKITNPSAASSSNQETLNTAPEHRRTLARTLINQVNTKRAIEAHNNAANGGKATIVIGGGASSSTPAPSPPTPQARRYHAAQVRVDAETLKIIEEQGDDTDILVIAPQAKGNITYRYGEMIRPGVLNNATQKRLLEAALRRAQDGDAILFAPQIQASLDGAGRRLADRRGADRARLREAAITALRNNRADQVIILLSLPQ
jgi:cellobiose-specific phosphotransferase system component IIB